MFPGLLLFLGFLTSVGCTAAKTFAFRGSDITGPVKCSESDCAAFLLCRTQIRELEESVRDEVEDAVKFADESPKPVRPALLPDLLQLVPHSGCGPCMPVPGPM